jgi:uncharacterized membrane protein
MRFDNAIRTEVQRPEGGRSGAARLAGHARAPANTLQDAAVVSWPQNRKKPQTRQIYGMAGAGAAYGALWGFLFGLIFFVPLLGMAMGAGMGALLDLGTEIHEPIRILPPALLGEALPPL